MAFSKTNLLLNGILRPLGWAAPVAIIGAAALALVPAAAAKLVLLAALTLLLALVFWKNILQPEDRTLVRLAGGHLIPASSRAQG